MILIYWWEFTDFEIVEKHISQSYVVVGLELEALLAAAVIDDRVSRDLAEVVVDDTRPADARQKTWIYTEWVSIQFISNFRQ